MDVAPRSLGEIVAVDLPQRIDARIAVLLPNTPVMIAAPSIKAAVATADGTRDNERSRFRTAEAKRDAVELPHGARPTPRRGGGLVTGAPDACLGHSGGPWTVATSVGDFEHFFACVDPGAAGQWPERGKARRE